MRVEDQQRLVEEAKEYCRKSLWYLCTNHLGYTDWDAVHDDLEKFLERPSRKKAILLPRGHLKTSIVTIARSIQAILKNPNVRILVANQIWDRARDILKEIRGHLEASQLPLMFGMFESKRWNEDSITIRQRKKPLKEPTIMTTGVEAETTGGHYDLIILDDLMGLQNSQTFDQREKAKRFRRSMLNLLEPGGELVEIGTRWHLDDTFSEILDKESKYYDIMVRQIIENGKIIFPKKFNKKFDHVNKTWSEMNTPCMDFINHLKESLPPYEFAAQYMNDPIDSENQVFRSMYFKYFNQRPEFVNVSMTVDLGISLQSTADQTAIVVCGKDSEHNIYILDYIFGRWELSQTVNNIFDKVSQWQPFLVGIESTIFQKAMKWGMENEMRRRNVYFGIDELHSPIQGKAKELRIKAMEPFYRQGMVHHAAWMKGKALESQLLSFPAGRHDDIIDALSYQLQVMSPGSKNTAQKTPYGTYEYYAKQADRFKSFYKGWFEYDA